MYFLKSKGKLPPSLEVPRTGLEYLFMSRAFLRAYMSDQIREMDPLEKAVLIPNLIVGNDHGGAEFSFNPIYLEPHEMVGISVGGSPQQDRGIPRDQWIRITRPFTSQSPAAFSGFCFMSSLVVFTVSAYDGSHLVLTTVKPNKLYAQYKKTQGEVR
jgi:hypothetical protein